MANWLTCLHNPFLPPVPPPGNRDSGPKAILTLMKVFFSSQIFKNASSDAAASKKLERNADAVRENDRNTKLPVIYPRHSQRRNRHERRRQPTPLGGIKKKGEEKRLAKEYGTAKGKPERGYEECNTKEERWKIEWEYHISFVDIKTLLTFDVHSRKWSWGGMYTERRTSKSKPVNVTRIHFSSLKVEISSPESIKYKNQFFFSDMATVFIYNTINVPF